jgi:hypothetical protein
LTVLPGLISELVGGPFSAKNKIAMAIFFSLGTVLPNQSSKALLAYRLKTGHRSALDFAKELIGWRVPVQN